MTEVERIVDQLKRTFDGEAWHGDPLMSILEGISAEHSGATWLPGTHTFYQLVVHITAWQREAARRVRERMYRELTAEQDWVESGEGSAAWGLALRDLQKSHSELVSAVRGMDPNLLDQIVPGSPNQSYYVLLHGVIQHTLYHAGQIAMLKKAFVERRPETYLDRKATR
jgi:uncharacterized damage-inducible protein DinB